MRNQILQHNPPPPPPQPYLSNMHQLKNNVFAGLSSFKVPGPRAPSFHSKRTAMQSASSRLQALNPIFLFYKISLKPLKTQQFISGYTSLWRKSQEPHISLCWKYKLYTAKGHSIKNKINNILEKYFHCDMFLLSRTLLLCQKSKWKYLVLPRNVSDVYVFWFIWLSAKLKKWTDLWAKTRLLVDSVAHSEEWVESHFYCCCRWKHNLFPSTRLSLCLSPRPSGPPITAFADTAACPDWPQGC